MTEAQAVEALYEQWQTGWEIIHPSIVGDPERVPYTFTNESFSDDQVGDLGAWVRVSMNHATAGQITHNKPPSRRFERRGEVFVQIFAPVDAGVLLLAELADDVRSVLEGVRIGDDFCTYAGRTQPNPEDGQWSMATVVIPFRYVETR